MQQPPPLRRIRASAGSGKTYTLTRHFLRLLAASGMHEGGGACLVAQAGTHNWPEIAAITFTNRAATEMKARLLVSLKHLALGHEKKPPAPWTPQLAASWLDVLLRHYSALNVRTIDSLLFHVVRMAALELGLSPDFQPVFSTHEALMPLLDSVLEQSREQPELRQTLRDACRDVLFHTPHHGFMAGKSLRTRVLDVVFAVQGLEGQLAKAPEIEERIASLYTGLQQAARHLLNCIEQEQLLAGKNALKAFSGCLSLASRDKYPQSTYFDKEEGLAACLNKGSPPPSEKAEKAYLALQSTLHKARQEVTALQGALALSPYLGLAVATADVLPDFLQGQSAIPAHIIPALARAILTNGFGVSEAFCRMGSRMSHLLIDEFQDTSRAQWQALLPLALESLAHGGSLTYVGDIKQSIYGWRGAEPGLFNEVLHLPELTAVAGQGTTDMLPTNWRSRAAVVRANNRIFSRLGNAAFAAGVLQGILGDKAEAIHLAGAARKLADAFADCAQLESGKADGFVRLERLEADSAPAMQELVLEKLVDQIREVHHSRPLGDITVLVRSNTQAALAAERLMAEGIAVFTENSLLLAAHPLIAQLVAFLEFLQSPTNDVALWTAISGQRIFAATSGLEPQHMEAWLAERPRKQSLHAALKEAGHGPFANLWSMAIAPFFPGRAGLISPYDLVCELVHKERLVARFPQDAAFVQRFLEVLHAAENNGYTSLSAFLEYFCAEGQNEKAPMPEHVDAVRVMTIHKSKGLQFPVVIVPWNALSPSISREAVPFDFTGADGSTRTALCPLKADMGALYYQAMAEAACESLHLLYVAWTRAEDELYAFINQGESIRRRANLGRVFDLLLEDLPSPWRCEGTRYELGTQYQQARGSTTPQNLSQKPGAACTPAPSLADSAAAPENPADYAPWQPMQWLPRVKIFRNTLGEAAFSPERRGRLVHRCLELIRISGQAEADAHKAFVLATATSLQGNSALAQEHKTDILAALMWYASLPEAAHWHRTGFSEQPLLDEQGALVRPDRLVEQQDGTWLVIDYKTGAPHPAHTRQISRYCELVCAATGAECRAVLVYVDQRRLVWP